MNVAKTEINLNQKKSDLREDVTLKPGAPTWVRDGFKELMALGEAPKAAIARLRQSPFFKEEWVA